MNKWPHCLLLLILVAPLLSGCWDRLEVEERIFVLAVAIDKAKQEGDSLPDYEVTVQLAEPRALSGKTPSTNMKPVWNVSATGPSLFDCMRALTTKVARVPFYEHLQVIVVSEELAKEGLSRPMDLFLRDHEMRRKIALVVTEGPAKKVLNIQHRLIPVPGIYLSILTKESLRKTARMPKDSTVGHFSSDFRAGRDTILTRVEPKGQYVLMEGGAVIKMDKFIGWFSDLDVRSYRWVNGTVEAGNYVIVKKHSQVTKNYTTFEVKSMRSIIKPHVQNGKPAFTISIRTEGHVGEDGLPPEPTNEDLLQIEQLLNEQLKKDVEDIIKKVQKKFGVDIFGFGEKLRRYEYAYWKKHRDNWDEIFRTVEFDVKVEASIRRIGHVK
ncbi:Ger(x)C family spore germination protein [Paenibacillus sp. NPDC056579]|uniref:Ger(x)C family spore germination protein n=1 Tax=Paenibacillus sp. NPDC056579 TaxID=3345871 RepID=UPI003687A809